MEKLVATDAEVLNVYVTVAEDRARKLFFVLVTCRESIDLSMLECSDLGGAVVWRWLVRWHEPDTAGRHASLPLQIFLRPPSLTTREAPWMQWTYSSRSTCPARGRQLRNL